MYLSAHRRGGGRALGRQPRNETPTVPTPRPLGPHLITIPLEELDVEYAEDEPATIVNCAYVASYSWTNSIQPTILVPGKPPTWTPPLTPMKLKPDAGEYFRDKNAARYPRFPTEPAVRALFTQQPAFATDKIDIFACGSTLGNLLRFCRKVKKGFRFDVEVVGSTVFLIRKENSSNELISEIRGFGHTFPEAYTSWDQDVRGSASHQRLVSYEFGGLRLIVRFESDGYYKDRVPSSSEVASPNSGQGSSSSSENGHLCSQLDELGSLALDSTKIGQASDDGLQIRHAGRAIPQTAIFDIKTRYKLNPIDMKEFYPLLWMKQIPNFLLAYNIHGVFNDVRKMDVSHRLKQWEQDNKLQLQRLATLLYRIVAFSREADEPKLQEEMMAVFFHRTSRPCGSATENRALQVSRRKKKFTAAHTLAEFS